MPSNVNSAEAGVPPYLSVLHDLPAGWPAFARAHALSERAADAGFRWPNVELVVKKVGEELGEVKKAVASRDRENLIEEIGDLMLAMVTLAVFTKTDPRVLSSGPTAVPAQEETALMAQMEEGLRQVQQAVQAGEPTQREAAIARMLAAVGNFSRAQGIDPEQALQRANDKFTYRFEGVATEAHAEGLSMEDMPLKELVRRWNKYKPGPEEGLNR